MIDSSAPIAQRTEHLTTDQEVGSSNLSRGANKGDAMGIDYEVKATYGTRVSDELMQELADEVLTEEQIEQGLAWDLPYEFQKYFGLDCDSYGDMMGDTVYFIVGRSAFRFNMRHDEDGAYRAIELETPADDSVLDNFIKKYNLAKPRWYAGMLVY